MIAILNSLLLWAPYSHLCSPPPCSAQACRSRRRRTSTPAPHANAWCARNLLSCAAAGAMAQRCVPISTAMLQLPSMAAPSCGTPSLARTTPMPGLDMQCMPLLCSGATTAMRTPAIPAGSRSLLPVAAGRQELAAALTQAALLLQASPATSHSPALTRSPPPTAR